MWCASRLSFFHLGRYSWISTYLLQIYRRILYDSVYILSLLCSIRFGGRPRRRVVVPKIDNFKAGTYPSIIRHRYCV